MMNTTKVNLLNSEITYINILDNTQNKPMFIKDMMPSELESPTNKTPKEEAAEHPIVSKLSERNYRDAYIIPAENDEVLLNVIPQKQFVGDAELRYIRDDNFEYFIEEAPTVDELPQFSLLDGTVFRVVGEGVKDIKDYTYYTIKDGQVQTIPNFKTAVVMLTERGSNVNNIRVVEPSEYNDLLMLSDINALVATGTPIEEAELLVSKGGGALSGGAPSASGGGGGGGGGGGSKPPKAADKSSEFSDDMEVETFVQSFESLASTAASAGALVDAARQEAADNIAAMQAENERLEAEAQQARAEAEAATAEANARIAEAAAAQAEAERDKARYASQNQGS